MARVRVRSASGALFRLDQVADVQYEKGQTEIERENLRQMVAVTGRSGRATGLAGDPAPEVTGESTGPWPTTKTVMTLPTSAGRSGPFKPGSWVSATARLPPYAMIAGALTETMNDACALDAPLTVTTSVAGPG